MNRKALILTTAAGVLCLTAAEMQVDYNREIGNAKNLTRLIVVTMPGGEYVIDKDDVISATASTYEIQGGMRVWEIMVTERSSRVVRFYYSRPIITKEDKEADEGGGKKAKLDTPGSGDGKAPSEEQEVRRREMERESKLMVPVRKEYPATTHLPMTEFRVFEMKELHVIYTEITSRVWGYAPPELTPALHIVKPDERIEDAPVWRDWLRENDD